MLTFSQTLLLGSEYDVQVVRIVEHSVHEVLDICRSHILDDILEIFRVIVVYII